MVTEEPDITERCGAEPASAQKDTGRGVSVDELTGYAVLANRRHHLRTTLSAVIGFSVMLMEDVGKTSCPAIDLQCINKAAKQILGVLIDVLEPIKMNANLHDADYRRIWATLHEQSQMPLSSLVSHGEHLIESVKTAEQQDLIDDLNIIRTHAKQVKSIIEQLVSPPDTERIVPGSAYNAAVIQETVGIEMVYGVYGDHVKSLLTKETVARIGHFPVLKCCFWALSGHFNDDRSVWGHSESVLAKSLLTRGWQYGLALEYRSLLQPSLYSLFTAHYSLLHCFPLPTS